MALAPPAARARPAARRGTGRRCAAVSDAAVAASDPLGAALRHQQARARGPEDPGHSHGVARARPVAAHQLPLGLRPARHGHGHARARQRGTTSPPAIVVSRLARERGHARDHLERLRLGIACRQRQRHVGLAGGSAPIAARSESATARALCPMSAGEWVERSKCTPSAIVSIEVTANGRARTTAASSPDPAHDALARRGERLLDRRDQAELGHGDSLTRRRPAPALAAASTGRARRRRRPDRAARGPARWRAAARGRGACWGGDS